MARRRLGNLAAAVAVLTVGVAGCSNSVIKNSAGGGAPGVTSSQIDVGSIANVTGPLSSGFAPVVNGVEAYFSMVNAAGGVAGRKLMLAHQKDDQGSPTVDLTDAQQLVQQDHVFAVVGVGTPFFGGASYLAQQGVPSFGYVVSTDWENKPTLFGTYGSVLNFATAAPGEAYLAQQLGAKSIGVVAYGVPQSADACRAAATGMRAFGMDVTFSDLNLVYGADPTTDVLHMKEHNVDFLLSCLDVNGNVAFARAISQNGLTMHQVWLDGYDQATLHQYGSIMTGVYFWLQHVPFEAAQAFPGVYPGMENYIREMRKYQPSFTYDEVALDGWISAALFVSGLKAVGRNLTQKKLAAAINAETAFTGGGLVSPVNWTTAHSTAKSNKPPYCGAGVHVVNGQFVPRVLPGTHEVYVCFDPTSTTPVPPLPGTPGT
ncbi:MAG: ABC transporter substrate-binding protein [Acidimicrobiales bacterium]|nr:ABC transporter substrate-binding protein [Acidimicrobiales bacterium]